MSEIPGRKIFQENGIWFPSIDPEEYVPTDVILLIKGIDVKSGGMKYREYFAPNLHPIEQLGMITTAQDSLREMIMGKLR